MKKTSESKMSLAKVEFNKLYETENSTRKDIINIFISKCGLTKAGASTYYSLIKKEYESNSV